MKNIDGTQEEIPDFVSPEETVDTPSVEFSDTETNESSSLDEDDLEDEVTLSYEEGLEDGLNLNTDLNTDLTRIDTDSIIIKRENTRRILAVIYIVATFTIFALGMFIAVLDGLNRDVSITDNLKEIIPLLSGVFLGTLGFVLGYYFKKGEE